MTRVRLPDTRGSVTKSFRIGGGEAWHVTVGLYEDGKPGELFIHPPRQGQETAGLADALAQSVSMGLQHGIPLSVYADKFRAMRFEPSGFTGDKDYPIALSRLDYIGQWLLSRFGSDSAIPSQEPSRTGPPCVDCGTIMIRSGSCYKCDNCGSTSGCS